MKNLFISYYLKKIKNTVSDKTKFYFYLIFNKSKLKDLFYYKKGKYPILYTVEDLLTDLLQGNISLDTPVTYQRIEDTYFTERKWHDGSTIKPWDTYKVKGLDYHDAIRFNKKIELGNLVKEGKLDKDEVGRYFYENNLIPIDLSENNEEILEKYVNAQSGFYNVENKIFCITAHI